MQHNITGVNQLHVPVYRRLYFSDTRNVQSGPDVAELNSTSVNVTFHVLVQLSAWNWNDDSLMSIRFGDPRLGGWDKEAGALVIKR